MPLFKVTIARRVPGERPRNPFLIDDIFSPRWSSTVERRVWDKFEAADEDEVRAFFADAKARYLEQVIGFELESITPVISEDAR